MPREKRLTFVLAENLLCDTQLFERDNLVIKQLINTEPSPSELSEGSFESSSLDDLIAVWKGRSLCAGVVQASAAEQSTLRSPCFRQFGRRSQMSTAGFRMKLGDGSFCLLTSRFGRNRRAGRRPAVVVGDATPAIERTSAQYSPVSDFEVVVP